MSTSLSTQNIVTAHHSAFRLTRPLVLLFAVTCGLSVANVYCAQPLLDRIARDFGIGLGSVGLVVTLTQAGYAIGLLLIVPLGDLVDRRRLIVTQLLVSVLALFTVAFAPNIQVLLAGLFIVGLLAVVVQVLVSFAATLALPEQRGRTVGTVTGGVVIGILVARSIAGTLTDISGWRSVYMTSAVLQLLMAGALWKALPSSAKIATPGSYRQIWLSVLVLWGRARVLRVRAGLAFFIFAAFSTLWTSLVLPLSSPPLLLSHSAIGSLGFVGVAGAIAAAYAGRLADRGLSRWTTGFALMLLFASWLPIGYLHRSIAGLVCGIILLDFAVQAVHVTNQSILFASLPEARSRLVAAYMTFYSIGSGAGSIASTWVYAHGGWTGVSILGAAISLVALLFWAATLRSSS